MAFSKSLSGQFLHLENEAMTRVPQVVRTVKVTLFHRVTCIPAPEIAVYHGAQAKGTGQACVGLCP